MTYDAAVVRKMNVDPSKWRWFNQNYDSFKIPDPSETEMILTEGTRVKRGWFAGFIIALSAYLLLLATPALATNEPMFSLPLMVGIILLLIGWLCVCKKTWKRVLGFTIYGFIAISAIMLIGRGETFEGMMTLLAIAVPYGIMRLCSKSFYRDGKLIDRPRQENGVELWNDPSRRVWGNAGGVASAVDKFGEEAVAAGVKGEENTLILLDMLLTIPGTTVFHGLKFPGSKDADVDHAVVHGSNVYLIDSKLYRWGAYEWQEAAGGDLIARSDGYGQPRKNHMAAAAQGYRALLGPTVNVVPIVLIHGKNVSVNGSTWSRSGVGMFTAQNALDYIGNGIGDNIRGWRDDVAARSIMLRNMKPW